MVLTVSLSVPTDAGRLFEHTSLHMLFEVVKQSVRGKNESSSLESSDEITWDY